MSSSLDPVQSLRVQCLRAFACLLLVSYHIVGASDSLGLKVADDSVWRQLVLALTPLRMPLFTFLSGYIYAASRTRSEERWVDFIGRKAARLLLPYLVLTPIFLAGQHLTGRAPALDLHALLGLYWVPDTFYWFLSALFLIFVFVSLWERRWPDTSLTGWLTLFGTFWILNLLQPIEPNVLGIGQALYLAPCFIAGLIARRYVDRLRSQRPSRTLLLCACSSYALYLAMLVGGGGEILAGKELFLIPVGCMTSLVLIRHFPVNATVGRLGAYSYSVFLYHVFFVTGTRLVLLQLGVESRPLLFTAALAAGLVGPVFVEKLLRRWHWTRLVLLGQPRSPPPLTASRPSRA